MFPPTCITLHLLRLIFICHFITQSLGFSSSFCKPSQTVLEWSAVNTVMPAAGYANSLFTSSPKRLLRGTLCLWDHTNNHPLQWNCLYLTRSPTCPVSRRYRGRMTFPFSSWKHMFTHNFSPYSNSLGSLPEPGLPVLVQRADARGTVCFLRRILGRISCRPRRGGSPPRPPSPPCPRRRGVACSNRLAKQGPARAHGSLWRLWPAWLPGATGARVGTGHRHGVSRRFLGSERQEKGRKAARPAAESWLRDEPPGLHGQSRKHSGPWSLKPLEKSLLVLQFQIPASSVSRALLRSLP